MANSVKHFIIYHFHFDKIAGTERVLFNIIEHLCSQEQNRVTLVLLSSETDLVFGLKDYPVEVVFLDIEQKSNKVTFFYNVYKKTRSFFKQNRITDNTIFLTTNYILGYILFRTTPKKLSRIISCEHFTVTATGRFSHYFRKLYYKHISVVMLTETDRNYIAENYNPKDCVCIPNATPFPLKSFNGNKNNIILAIGRYSYQKGFDLLLEAFSELTSEFEEWKLLIVGDDYGEKDKMLKIIDDLRLDNVELVPATSEIEKLYNSSTFYVMSSRFEGLPMVLLEAMSFGLPIVSFNCPTGPKEVVDESNGILVKNGDVKALSQAMMQIMSDRDLLISKAKGAGLKARNYSKEVINKKWDELFDKI